MDPRLRHIFRIIIGVFFLILGVISFAIPFLSGWVFILIGLAFLGSHKARHALALIKKKIKRWFGSRTASLIIPSMPDEDRKPRKKNI